MVRSIILAASGVLGLLTSTQAQFSSSTIASDSVNLLLLGKENPTATVTAAVRQVSATRTVYYINCAISLEMEDGKYVDPCPLIGGSVIQEPTRWEYDISKATEEIRGTGMGTFTAEYTSATEGTIVCNVTSNTAKCTGTLTSYHVTRGKTTTGSTVIRTQIADVSASLEPVSITEGIEKLRTSTTTSSTNRTSSSTGVAPLVTQPARLLAGAVVIVGGVFMV